MATAMVILVLVSQYCQMTDLFLYADRYKSIKQFIRYGLVGIASNLSGYLVFLVITYLGVEPKIAMTLLYIVGATIGFFGHRQWSFAYKGTLLKSVAKYFIAHLLGYMINLTLLFIFVDKLGYSHQWVQATAIFLVAGFLFIVFKYFVFPKAVNLSRCPE